MRALSIKNRIEWALVGLVISLPLFYLTYYMYVNEGTSAGLACSITGLLGIAILRQFLFGPPRKSFCDWWKYSTAPGYYGTLRCGTPGVKIIRPVLWDFNEVYDLEGNLIGHEQEFELEADEHDHYPLCVWRFTPVETGDQRRMPLIAYLRTKAVKPLGMA